MRPEQIAISVDGAAFATDPDPETGFTLFGPVPHPGTGSAAGRRVFALRLRPNQDLSASLEAFCRERDIAAAELHGGVGSIIAGIESRFQDGRIKQVRCDASGRKAST
jgi:hypothetical protein